MADLINKWDVVSKLIDLENEFQQYKPFRGFEHAMHRKICELEMQIGKTPTVDAVEVVHCYECKKNGNDEECPLLSMMQYTEDDDFCSYGERREGE